MRTINIVISVDISDTVTEESLEMLEDELEDTVADLGFESTIIREDLQ